MSGDFLQVFQIIGGIGKNNMVLLFANLNKPENIHTYRVNSFQIHFLCYFSDKPDRPGIVVHQIDFGASARGKFKTYAACSTEQVQHQDVFKIKMIGQNIKQCFPGEIGSGP